MILNFVFFVPSWWRLFSAFYPQETRKSHKLSAFTNAVDFPAEVHFLFHGQVPFFLIDKGK